MDELHELELSGASGDKLWEDRLSPTETVEFFDRKKKIEYTIPKEQEETGKEIDNAFKREMLLRNNPKEFQLSDYTKILYRLPIREDVLENIYNDIINNIQR